LKGKSIDNIKIYSFEHAKAIALNYRVKFIFMAEDDPDVEMKNKIVDYCLTKDIRLKAIPAVQNWVDGQLRVRQLKDLKIEDLLNRPSIELAPEQVREYLTGKEY
jgi:FlaA1/EpsC-like NDP-sugar epimerase